MIIVTGYKGFVGKHLCKRLGTFSGIDIVDGVNITNCPLPDARKVERVYHLAAQTDAQCDHAEKDAYVNIIGTVRLLEKYGDKVVLASSSMIHHPVVPYAVSKLACELYGNLFGAAIVRFCNLYGEGGHSCWDIFEREDVLTIYGDGDQVRTYAPVSRAVEELLVAKPGVIKVISGTDLSVNQLAAMHPEKQVKRVDARINDLECVVQ